MKRVSVADKRWWWPAIAWLGLAGAWDVSAQTEADVVAFQDVTLIDLRNGELHPNQTVVWERSRIVAAGPAATVRLAPHTQIIRAAGRFLLPGLWDMHVHVPSEEFLPLFIANGVTAVRDMSDVDEQEDYRRSAVQAKRRWDAEARAGLRVGPRIVALGTFTVNGHAPSQENGLRPQFLGATTPAAARKLVRFFVDEGSADFIKVYSGIPRDAYFALMDEARRAGIVVSGHKPLAVSYVEAADAGQRSIEHAREMLLDSFPGALELQRNPAERNLPPARLRPILDAHEPRMLHDILAAMRRNGTYYVPTHLTRLFDWKAAARDSAYLDDPRLRNLPQAAQKAIREDVASTQARAPTPEDAAIYRAFFEKGLDVTRQAHEAGVRIMAGTDAGDSYCFHGSGLHDELAWMAQSGLSPLTVLQAATVVPAEYVGRSQDFGALQPGRLADMVLLDRNPLADIRNTRAIRAVVFNGRLFDRAALDAILTGRRSAIPQLGSVPDQQVVSFFRGVQRLKVERTETCEK